MVGFEGVRVARPEDLEAGIRGGFSHPNPALPYARIDRFGPGTPPIVEPSQVCATAPCPAEARVEGRASDVIAPATTDFATR